MLVDWLYQRCPRTVPWSGSFSVVFTLPNHNFMLSTIGIDIWLHFTGEDLETIRIVLQKFGTAKFCPWIALICQLWNLLGQWPSVLRGHACGLVTFPVFGQIHLYSLNFHLHYAAKCVTSWSFKLLALLYLSSCLHWSQIVFQAAMWYELHEEHRWKCGGDTANHLKYMRIVAIWHFLHHPYLIQKQSSFITTAVTWYGKDMMTVCILHCFCRVYL